MGLSGADVAYRFAIADEEPRGKTRADTTRSGFFSRDAVPVWLNGAARSGVVQSSLRIDLNTGEEPHRCSFDLKGGSGYVPQAGHSVVIGHGTTANPLFAGRILKASRVVIRHDDRRPTYRCDAAGHVFELGTSRVAKWFYAQSLSPGSIVRGVFAVTTPSVSSMGFGADYIGTDLPAVETFSMGPTEDMASAFGRLFRSVDAVWYTDHSRKIHAFLSVDSATGTIPSTVTAANSQGVWGLEYTATDMSRVFTRAHVVGAAQQTLADFVPSRHITVPVESASIISNLGGASGSDVYVGSTEDYLFAGRKVTVGNFFRPESQFNCDAAAIAFPVKIGANTLVVVGEDLGVEPIDSDRWYDVGGQWVYVSSTIGLYSVSGGSIAYNYFVNGSGSGSVMADIASFSPLASAWQITIPASNSLTVPIIPAGSNLSVYVTRVNSTARDYVSSLMGSTNYGLISQTFEDGTLGPDGAAAVALAALDRGHPSQWTLLEFTTRERDYNIGRPVYLSLTAPAESGGPSIVGAFTAQDMSIGGFDRLTPTLGPERTVRAGAVRRPTLWQVLQGV